MDRTKKVIEALVSLIDADCEKFISIFGRFMGEHLWLKFSSLGHSPVILWGYLDLENRRKLAWWLVKETGNWKEEAEATMEALHHFSCSATPEIFLKIFGTIDNLYKIPAWQYFILKSHCPVKLYEKLGLHGQNELAKEISKE